MRLVAWWHVPDETLAELADGLLPDADLSPSERRHLATCDRCQALLEGHRRAGRLLASPWRTINVDRALDATGAPGRVIPVVGSGRLFGPPGAGLVQFAQAAGIVAVVAVIALALWSGGGPPPSGGPGGATSPRPTVVPTTVPSLIPSAAPSPTPAPGGLQFSPQHLAQDGEGRVYATDCTTGSVFRVGDLAGPVAVIGTGSPGFSGDGGPATEAQLQCPYGLAFDAAGNLLVADTGNHRIRMVDAQGVITTIVGSGPGGWTNGGFAGDGGPATEALLRNPAGIAFDGAGNLYIADMNNQRIRMVDTEGVITTVAGSGTLFPSFGGDGGAAVEAILRSPQGIAVDALGNVYFTDTHNNRLRMIDREGRITTIAGTGEIASYGDGGPAAQAALAAPRAVALDGAGNIYVSEAVFDVVGSSTPIVPEGAGNRVRRIDGAGVIHPFAGTGQIGHAGDGGPATQAQLHGVNQNFGLAVDSASNVYIADSGNRRLRVVDRFGIITTFADGSR